jgi:serine/threonine protein phosphatase PrpC
MKYYFCSLRGKRPTNEDTHIISKHVKEFEKTNNNNIFCVFDGHGGKEVSEFLAKHFCYFLKDINLNVNDIKKISKVIKDKFLYINSYLKNLYKKKGFRSGSTACCVFHNTVKNHLWIANIGDSRAVICDKYNRAIQLTVDHKPNDPKEKKRIENENGKIYHDGYTWRVGTLSLSRSFGDFDSPHIIAKPDVSFLNLNDASIIDDNNNFNVTKNKNNIGVNNTNYKFLIIACDGLWDVIDNQTAINMVNKLIHDLKKIDYARYLAMQALKIGSTDNVSVIIYFFK